jgi:hypothetical protein
MQRYVLQRLISARPAMGPVVRSNCSSSSSIGCSGRVITSGLVRSSGSIAAQRSNPAYAVLTIRWLSGSSKDAKEASTVATDNNEDDDDNLEELLGMSSIKSAVEKNALLEELDIPGNFAFARDGVPLKTLKRPNVTAKEHMRQLLEDEKEITNDDILADVIGKGLTEPDEEPLARRPLSKPTTVRSSRKATNAEEKRNRDDAKENRTEAPTTSSNNAIRQPKIIDPDENFQPPPEFFEGKMGYRPVFRKGELFLEEVRGTAEMLAFAQKLQEDADAGMSSQEDPRSVEEQNEEDLQKIRTLLDKLHDRIEAGEDIDLDEYDFFGELNGEYEDGEQDLPQNLRSETSKRERAGDNKDEDTSDEDDDEDDDDRMDEEDEGDEHDRIYYDEDPLSILDDKYDDFQEDPAKIPKEHVASMQLHWHKRESIAIDREKFRHRRGLDIPLAKAEAVAKAKATLQQLEDLAADAGKTTFDARVDVGDEDTNLAGSFEELKRKYSEDSKEYYRNEERKVNRNSKKSLEFASAYQFYYC